MYQKFNRPLPFIIIISLLIAGNCFAFFNIHNHPEEIMRLHPRLTSDHLSGIQVIQIVNIVCLLGIFAFRKWAVWLFGGLALLVLGIDLYFQIWYHVIVLLIGVGLTLFVVYQSRHSFT